MLVGKSPDLDVVDWKDQDKQPEAEGARIVGTYHVRNNLEELSAA